MNNFNDKILDLVKEHLPQIQVDNFTKRLDELKTLADQVEPLKLKVATLEQTNSDLKKDNSILRALDNKKTSLDARDHALKKNEDEFYIKNEILKEKELYLTTRVNDHKEIFNTVFKNTIVRETVNGSVTDRNDYTKAEDTWNTVEKTKE